MRGAHGPALHAFAARCLHRHDGSAGRRHLLRGMTRQRTCLGSTCLVRGRPPGWSLGMGGCQRQNWTVPSSGNCRTRARPHSLSTTCATRAAHPLGRLLSHHSILRSALIRRPPLRGWTIRVGRRAARRPESGQNFAFSEGKRPTFEDSSPATAMQREQPTGMSRWTTAAAALQTLSTRRLRPARPCRLATAARGSRITYRAGPPSAVR